MKNILFFSLSFFCLSLYSQQAINYSDEPLLGLDSVMFQADETTQLIVEIAKEQRALTGYAICTEFKTDTLNKSELHSVDYKASKDNLSNQILHGSGWYKNDTLMLAIGSLMGSEFICHIISKESVTSKFFINYRIPLYVKHTEQDSFSSRMSIPLELDTFVLNTEKPAIGGMAKGFASFTTSPYFIKSSYLFDHQILHVQSRYTYYFEFPILYKMPPRHLLKINE